IGGEVLDGDVAHRDDLLRDLDAVRLRDIELDAPLALVVLVEVPRSVDSRLSVRPRGQHAQRAHPAHRLHANDLGAHVRELHGASWARPDPGEIGDADAFEGARTKRLAATSHCVHSGVSISSTSRCHWYSSTHSTKIQPPSLHWKKSIGWMGRWPQRAVGMFMYGQNANVFSSIAVMHSCAEISTC